MQAKVLVSLPLFPDLSRQFSNPTSVCMLPCACSASCAAPTASRSVQAVQLVEQLAGAVGAELSGSLCAYELAFGINTVARAEFTHMQQELAAWEPLVKVRRARGRAGKPSCRVPAAAL